MNQIFLLVFLAALGPIIGTIIGVWKKPKEKGIFNYLAFAAGVMIGVSLISLLPESLLYTPRLNVIIGLLLGFLFMFVVEYMVPHTHHHQCHKDKMAGTAVLLIIGLAIHNIPEGMAIGIGSFSSTNLSTVIALAIAIHNIPEGICSSAPYYFSSGQRLKTFLISSSTAIPTIIGFLIAYYWLDSMSKNFVGIMMAATAGIMLHISFFELLPASQIQKGLVRWGYLGVGILLVVLFDLFL